MKIGLIGYGKMGKAIEHLAKERGHSIDLIIDLNNPGDLTLENLKKLDVVIEFTIPKAAIANIKLCMEAGVPVVSGTTGWLDELDAVLSYMKEQNGGLFYASNYSLGVNIFFELNKYLAKLMNKFSEYEVSLEEVHHIQKLDAPSGTALTIAQGLLDNIDRKEKWTLSEQKAPEHLVVNHIRRAQVPGTHTVRYESEIDELTITHEAKSRTGFAMGAVLAAEFMQNKTGFKGMSDLLNI